MSGIDDLFSGMRIAASGLSAERVRMDVIAENIANARTTRTPGGGPYRRKVVEFEPLLVNGADGSKTGNGVRAARIVEDMDTPMELVRDPSSPDADADGFVEMPNVNTLREMADLLTAMRAYDAGMAMQDAYVRSAERALELMR
jgi:flagellar basal-body rod protein FlgC